MAVTSNAVKRRLDVNAPQLLNYKPVGTTAQTSVSHQEAVDNTMPNYENVDQFDFNRNYEDTLDQLRRQQADVRQQYDLGNQRTREAYERKLRQINQNKGEALTQDQSRLANQGILRSGIAVKSQGDIGNQFQSEADSYQRQLATELENRESQYAQTQRQIQEQIGRAQEFQTRQQQQLEEQRARQAAAAEAAQAAADAARLNAEQAKPKLNVVKDNLGKYFIVDPDTMTRQSVDPGQLGALNQTHNVNQITTMDQAAQLFGGDYQARAAALARRLGGDLSGAPSLDVRLGFRNA